MRHFNVLEFKGKGGDNAALKLAGSCQRAGKRAKDDGLTDGGGKVDHSEKLNLDAMMSQMARPSWNLDKRLQTGEMTGGRDRNAQYGALDAFPVVINRN